MTKRYSKKKQAILNSIPIFLSKTYQIVDNPQYSDIISWSDDKQAFIIKDVAALTGTILPKHFKHNNFASFVRQLNMYGFHKVRSNNEEGHVFEHEYFKKDNMDLLPQIKRKNATGALATLQSNNSRMQQQANQGQMVLAVPKNNRQFQLQKKIQQLSQKQQQLQNIVGILVDQNKQVINQNKNFVSRMTKMDLKYRKKLQTLIWMVLMAGRSSSDKPLMIPPQAANMIKALKDGGDSDQQGFGIGQFARYQDSSKNNKEASTNVIQKYSRKKSQKNGNNLVNQQNYEDMLSKMLKNDSDVQLSGMQSSNQNLYLSQQNSVDSLLRKMNAKGNQNKNKAISNLSFDSKQLLKGQSQDKQHLNDLIIPPSPNNSFMQPPSPIRSERNQLSELLDHINSEDYEYARN